MSSIEAYPATPELVGDFGMVSSTHWLASSAGMAMLEKGGNAFDAAAAAGFVLQIVEPHLNGVGGELPAIFYSATEDAVRVLCAQGSAPQDLSIALVRNELGLSSVPGTGLLAAVVPGAFGGWMRLLADYGTLDLATVLEPAIGYAANGFPVLPRVGGALVEMAPFFAEHWPSSAETWTAGDLPTRAGQRISSPRIAKTYQRILAEAQAGGGSREQVIERAIVVFYQGFVAEAIDGFLRAEPLMDTSGRRHRGVLTGADMAGWQARYEAPVSRDYHGLTVHKTGPWGQGPVLLQTLALLEGFELGAMDPLGPDYVHLVVEASKLAFADREIFYGDPDFVDVPLDHLLSADYTRQRRALIDMERASTELRPGSHGDSQARLDYLLANAGRDKDVGMGTGEPTFARLPGDTVHLDVVDRFGNMVSATPSGGWFQASPAIPELGFCLSTRAQMFWLDETMPSALVPGKRPRTTLTPTLITREGRPVMGFGTPGGDQQDQWSLQLLLGAHHFGRNMQTACDAPLFHTEHFPSSFFPRAMKPAHLAIENRFPEATLSALRERGHQIDPKGPFDLGRLCGVAASGGFLRASATARHAQCRAVGR